MTKKEAKYLPGVPVNLNLFLALEPVAKGRPRFGQGRTFTPPETKYFETAIAILARRNIKSPPLNCPVSVIITFYMTKPNKPCSAYPLTTPDLDNLIKGVCDALNGIAWTDDARIVDCYARKRWALGSCGIHIQVTNQIQPDGPL